MKKVILLAILSLGSALAATTYVQSGITYVNLDQFAQENGVTVINNYGDITLKKSGQILHLADDPSQSMLNGSIFAMSAAATNIAGNIVVPLADLQKAFGMKVTVDIPAATPPASQQSKAASAPAQQLPVTTHYLDAGSYRGDCGKLQANDELENGAMTLRYYSSASFPKEAGVKVFDAPFKYTCNNSTIFADGQTIKIKSSTSIADAWHVIDNFGEGLMLDDASWYEYPNLKLDMHVSQIVLHHNGNFYSTSPNNQTSLATIAYKVNGGALKPIYFDGNYYKVRIPDSQVVDIYIRGQTQYDRTEFQRMTLDPGSKSITIYKKFSFPAN